MSEAKKSSEFGEVGVVMAQSAAALVIWFIIKQMIPFTDDWRLAIMFASAVLAGACYMHWGNKTYGYGVSIFLFVSYWTAIGKINTISAETFICMAVLVLVLTGINYTRTKGWTLGAISVIAALLLAPYGCYFAISIMSSGGGIPLPTW